MVMWEVLRVVERCDSLPVYTVCPLEYSRISMKFEANS